MFIFDRYATRRHVFIRHIIAAFAMPLSHYLYAITPPYYIDAARERAQRALLPRHCLLRYAMLMLPCRLPAPPACHYCYIRATITPYAIIDTINICCHYAITPLRRCFFHFSPLPLLLQFIV